MKSPIHIRLLSGVKSYFKWGGKCRSVEVSNVQDVAIAALVSLMTVRDSETGDHILRVQRYVRLLAELLSSHYLYSQFLTPEYIRLLFLSAPLHDVGKIGIPDEILFKPGRLTGPEYEIMKAHTVIGRDAIQHAENSLNVAADLLSLPKEIAYSHHERWDGTGYPQGLVGVNIPLSGRLLAVADVYDALVSARVYKAGMTHEKAIEVISRGRGSHFDPEIVDVFLSSAEKFRAIADGH